VHKIVITANSSWNLFNFRSGLIASFIAEGHEVITIAPKDEYTERLVDLGARHIPIFINPKGTRVLQDLLLLFSFLRILNTERPDFFLSYTIKPNIYGSIAANYFKISVINNISGLGATFITNNYLTYLVQWLYKFALRRSNTVFFQNRDDFNFFIHQRLVRRESAKIIPGSGVNLNKFKFLHLPPRDEAEEVNFLLIGRMLWDKGIGEYVEAARLVQKIYPSSSFSLLGFLDAKNPTAISSSQIQEWVAEGVIDYLGQSDDVSKEIAKTDCVVLPSYREGVPRSLLEGAALGRPLIATNVPGCKEAIEHGFNGYLCKPYDHDDLAMQIIAFIELKPEDRQAMGVNGRTKIVKEFDEKIVIEKYFSAIYDALSTLNN